MSPKLIFIVGPTCIGKSNLAIKIAKKLKAEIINADSMQVYSNLRILTARPSNQDTKMIKHHLYVYIDGSTRYNVATWCKDASKIINSNFDNKISSIVVGGTGMYIDKILNGLIQIPKIPEKIKKDSEFLLNEKGSEKFAKLVKAIDLKAVNKISNNDIGRLRRIWEVNKFTDNNLSYWLQNKNKKYLKVNNYLIYLFTPDRKIIYEKVNNRFLKMIKKGAIDEVSKLYSLDLDVSLPIMRAHGVPEIIKYLSNSITLEECIKKGQQVTRNYVKRQFTWWRSSRLQINQILEHFPDEIDLNLLKF